MTRLFIIGIFLLGELAANAQIGGNQTFAFLNIPSSARTAALGGAAITLRDGDLNLVEQNPSLLDSNMDKHLAFTYINYIADINTGHAAFARHLGDKGTIAGSLNFFSYGNFERADVTGQRSGEFSAGDYALNLSYARALDSLFSVGGSFKVIYSNLDSYQAVGLALDLSGSYQSRNKLFYAGMVIRNLGMQVKSYVKGNRQPLPLQVNLGISQKLSKAPIRLSLHAMNLQKWDLTYETTVDQDNTTEATAGEDDDNLISFDKLMRHMVFGVEFLPSKNFHIRLGYNYQRRQELAMSNRPALSGISFGLGMKISKYHLSYALSRYHLAGTSNHLTVTTNLSEFRSKSKR